jgi:hypothetical protein
MVVVVICQWWWWGRLWRWAASEVIANVISAIHARTSRGSCAVVAIKARNVSNVAVED